MKVSVYVWAYKCKAYIYIYIYIYIMLGLRHQVLLHGPFCLLNKTWKEDPFVVVLNKMLIDDDKLELINSH
jgi:hypothetical protein